MSSTAVSQSVHQKLLNIRDKTGEDFNHLLIRYGLERLLYRLIQSGYGQQFVLKGAMLFALWDNVPRRSTRDIDLLGFEEVSHKRLQQVITDACNVIVLDDGLRFDQESITTSDIRDDQEYHGIRVTLSAFLGNARLPIQMDVGYGDALSPNPATIQYPAILSFPTPLIRAYHPATVIAEKFNAMVVLGMMNSRLKDFYDIYVILNNMNIDKVELAEAIESTFKRRNTPLPTVLPVAFTDEFSHDKNKETQWKAFLKRSELAGFDIPFCEIVHAIKEKLWPIVEAITTGLKL